MLPHSLGRFLLHFVMKQKRLFIALVVTHLVWALDFVAWPYMFGYIVDVMSEYTGNKDNIWSALSTILVIYFGFWFFVEVMYRTYDYVSHLFFPRFEADIRTGMVDYVTEHSFNYFSNNFSGSIANKISDMPSSANSIITLAVTLFIPAVTAFIIATSLFANLHPLFGLVLAFWVVGHLGICFYHANRCDELSHVHADSRSELSGKIVDAITNIVSIKSFARKRYEMSYIGKYQNTEYGKHKATLRYIFKVRMYLGIFCFLFGGVVPMLLMVHQWQQGVITTGDFVFIFHATWNILIMAWISGLELPNLYKEIGVCKQSLELVNVKHGITDKENAKELQVSDGEIKFDNVTFNYGYGENIFENKNVHIKAGEKVGLVGFSGSGKTSFVNLLTRYYDVKGGAIYIDGQDISFVTQESLRAHISMIPQDPTLFHRSLSENIAYGDLDASDEKILHAAKLAHCNEFIEKLEDGYDTLVGERGVKLSGGQRQRIALARAILKDAPILILDEATSALDSVTEKVIQESLSKVMQGRTTIVVAHRLSTLYNMDRILVFSEGKIIEEGSHKDLVSKKGHYFKLWQMQSDGFLPDSEQDGEVKDET